MADKDESGDNEYTLVVSRNTKKKESRKENGNNAFHGASNKVNHTRKRNKGASNSVNNHNHNKPNSRNDNKTKNRVANPTSSEKQPTPKQAPPKAPPPPAAARLDQPSSSAAIPTAAAAASSYASVVTPKKAPPPAAVVEQPSPYAASPTAFAAAQRAPTPAAAAALVGGGVKLPSRGKPITVQIKIRDTRQNRVGQVMVAVNAATLGELKAAVIGKLQPFWNELEVNLEPINIRVFYKGKNGGEPTELEPFPEEKQLSKKCDYWAMEYFTRVPITLLRTVKLEQLEKCAFTHPGHRSGFTKVSSFYCAAMTASEAEAPWYCLSQTGLKARGCSLRCSNDHKTTLVQPPYNPFGSIGQNETKGEFRMTINQYDQQFGNDPNFPNDENFGLLFTSATHQPAGPAHDVVYYQMATSITLNDGKSDDDVPKKRAAYFRFALDKGVNLGEHNMAVVFDQSSDLHWTLVRENPITGLGRKWAFSDVHAEVYLPVEHKQELEALVDGQLDGKLRELYKPEDDLTKEPTTVFERIAGGMYSVFPKVAALFRLHDLSIKASAEPLAPTPSSDDSSRAIHLMCVVLFHYDHLYLDNHNLQVALAATEEVDYIVEKLDGFLRWTLLDAIERACYTQEEIDKISFEVTEEEIQSAQNVAIRVLKGSFNQSSVAPSVESAPVQPSPLRRAHA